ncbi:class II holin family protein [Escherichia coli]
MYQMEKISTGIAYGTSAGSAGYWFLQWLDQVSPSQWAAIGVLGSLFLGFLTYLTNLYFKIKEDRRFYEVSCGVNITGCSLSENSFPLAGT